ncbi:MAG: ABC transporter permease subunit [Roseicyclus sp.]|nr:ABC transporter permease subunit [Roseicyclus sp.]
MSTPEQRQQPSPGILGLDRPKAALLCLGLAVLLAIVQFNGLLPEYLHRLPETLEPPFAIWLDAAFNFIKDDLGLLTFTRFLTGGLEWVLDVTGNLLFGRRRWPYLGPIPWSAIAAAMAVLGYWLGGWRIAALVGGTTLWTALVGQWEIAMQTMSVLIVAAPVAFMIGLSVGIAAWKYPRVERIVKPFLALLQTLPFFTYLLPAVIFFKVGPTAGAVATVIFAVPPMVLMTILGLQKVSPEVVEAGKMSGCSRFQMLRHVYLPSARTEILVGVNQVIMLCLAMVVLTAFIGMPGLGAKLLEMMGSFRLGRSFEVGVTIVLLAVSLDRMSKAWVAKQPEHFEKGTSWWQIHKLALIGVSAFIFFLILAQFLPILAEIGRRQSLSQGREIDGLMRSFLALDWVRAITYALRVFFNNLVLIPFRNFLLSLPTPAIILLIVSLGLWLAGRKQALIAGLFFSLVALSGWWDRAIITLYSVISAVTLAAIIGLPIAVIAARKESWARRVLLACDTAQTFPSFVYLLPAIMLFGITDIAVVFSILIFATVPLVRYTIEGLRTVPAEINEAADMSGATRMQKLLKVQLPLAFPTMVVGINQAIMFAFFMVIIAAFIGTQDLGQELQRTLAGTNLGTNFVLGLCVSLMALSFDTIIMKWAADRKRDLGLGSE